MPAGSGSVSVFLVNHRPPVEAEHDRALVVPTLARLGAAFLGESR